jgi:hypothetical protein
MARKFDVAIIFPAFLQRVVNQFNTCVKIIQSDGGGEFVNQGYKIVLYPMALFTDYHVPIHQSKMD